MRTQKMSIANAVVTSDPQATTAKSWGRKKPLLCHLWCIHNRFNPLLAFLFCANSVLWVPVDGETRAISSR